MLTLLALGTMPFWLFCVAVTVGMFALIEFEKPGWATIVFLGALGLLELCGSVPVWETIRSNPLHLIWIAALYVVIGAAWSVGKWALFVNEIASNFKEATEKFVRDNKITLKEDGSIPEGFHIAFQDFIEQINYSRSKGVKKPILNQNKGRIYIWIGYWPWSFVWTIINDPVKRLIKFVYRQLQAVYQKIVDKMFTPFAKELAVLEKDTSAERKKIQDERLAYHQSQQGPDYRQR